MYAGGLWGGRNRIGKFGNCGEAELCCEKARRCSVGVRTVDGGGGVCSRMPFEPFEERVERKTRRDSCFEGVLGELLNDVVRSSITR